MNLSDNGKLAAVVFALRQLWTNIYGSCSRMTLKRGITVVSAEILLAVWLSKSSTVTEIAALLQRDKGTISKNIYSLKRSGLVVKLPGIDNRSFEFELTVEGKKLLLDLTKDSLRNSSFLQAFDTLDEAEKDSFIQITFKLIACMEGEQFLKERASMLNKINDAF